MPEISRGFPPVAAPRARVLVLGSLPGRMSLEMQQYYAQPRNAFWPIIGSLVGVEPAADYAVRIAALRRSGIALWDVLAAASRPGSLDSSIVAGSMQVNDFGQLFERCPRLGAVFFNGRKAAATWQRHVLPQLEPRFAALPATTLPSTSPAYAAMPLGEKARLWHAALGRVLEKS